VRRATDEGLVLKVARILSNLGRLEAFSMRKVAGRVGQWWMAGQEPRRRR